MLIHMQNQSINYSMTHSDRVGKSKPTLKYCGMRWRSKWCWVSQGATKPRFHPQPCPYPAQPFHLPCPPRTVCRRRSRGYPASRRVPQSGWCLGACRDMFADFHPPQLRIRMHLHRHCLVVWWEKCELSYRPSLPGGTTFARWSKQFCWMRLCDWCRLDKCSLFNTTIINTHFTLMLLIKNFNFFNLKFVGLRGIRLGLSENFILNCPTKLWNN